jgi:hypothetical protein
MYGATRREPAISNTMTAAPQMKEAASSAPKDWKSLTFLPAPFSFSGLRGLFL